MNQHERLINQIDEIIKSGIGSTDYMIGKIESLIDSYNESKPKTIKQIVSDYHQLKDNQISIKLRKREIVEARQIAMYFYKNYTKLSLKNISLEFAYLDHLFDHATVLHAIKTVNDLIDSDKLFKAKIEEIEKEVKQYY